MADQLAAWREHRPGALRQPAAGQHRHQFRAPRKRGLRALEEALPGGQHGGFAALRLAATEEHRVVGHEAAEAGEVALGHALRKGGFGGTHLGLQRVHRLGGGGHAGAQAEAQGQGQGLRGLPGPGLARGVTPVGWPAGRAGGLRGGQAGGCAGLGGRGAGGACGVHDKASSARPTVAGTVWM